MSLSNSMKKSILSYLYGQIDLKELRATIAPLALDAGESRDQEDLRIANQLLADFADLDTTQLSEQGFRQNLLTMLFTQYIEFDALTQQIRTATSTSGETGSFAFAGTGRAAVFA